MITRGLNTSGGVVSRGLNAVRSFVASVVRPHVRVTQYVDVESRSACVLPEARLAVVDVEPTTCVVPPAPLAPLTFVGLYVPVRAELRSAVVASDARAPLVVDVEDRTARCGTAARGLLLEPESRSSLPASEARVIQVPADPRFVATPAASTNARGKGRS